MGWSGGGLFGELIWVIQKNVPDDSVRREIYEHMVDSFREADWDALDECLGSDPVYDAIYREIYPDGDEDDDGEERDDY